MCQKCKVRQSEVYVQSYDSQGLVKDERYCRECFAIESATNGVGGAKRNFEQLVY